MRRIPFRARNPVLTYKTYRNQTRAKAGDAMTIAGTINKTTFALILLSISSIYTWNLIDDSPKFKYLISIGFICGLSIAILTFMKREIAKYTLPIYSLLKGMALGGLSLYFERRYPGIISTAIFLTFGGLGALLLLYRSGLIKISQQTRSVIYVITAGIFIVYIFSWVLHFIDVKIPVIHDATIYGILFSLFAITMASLNLILDFQYIENGARYRNLKDMEWYYAFGLLITLVWFYIEIPRLFSKILRFRG